MECAQVTENKEYGPRPKYGTQAQVRNAWPSRLARVYVRQYKVIASVPLCCNLIIAVRCTR